MSYISHYLDVYIRIYDQPRSKLNVWQTGMMFTLMSKDHSITNNNDKIYLKGVQD